MDSDFAHCREARLQITGDKRSLDLCVTKAESVEGLDAQEQRHVINLHVLEMTWGALGTAREEPGTPPWNQAGLAQGNMVNASLGSRECTKFALHLFHWPGPRLYPLLPRPP